MQTQQKFQIQKTKSFLAVIGPDQRWQNISKDFVIGILIVKGANAIYNIVDRLSKKHHHITTNKKIDVKKLADLFVHHV